MLTRRNRNNRFSLADIKRQDIPNIHRPTPKTRFLFSDDFAKSQNVLRYVKPMRIQKTLRIRLGEILLPNQQPTFDQAETQHRIAYSATSLDRVANDRSLSFCEIVQFRETAFRS